jgi:predicted DNA-binding transcriptional regulator AlpA
MGRLIDKLQAADRLGIGDSQLHQLSKNPTFPKPQNGKYAEDEIDEWKRKFDRYRAKRYRVPECFYPWQFE